MGRMAAHTGKEVTFDQMLNSDFEMSPNTDKFTMNSPAPLVADANGRYPVPQPGIMTHANIELGIPVVDRKIRRQQGVSTP